MSSIQEIDPIRYQEILDNAPRYFYNQTPENALTAKENGQELRLIAYEENGRFLAAGKLTLQQHHHFFRRACLSWFPNYFQEDPAGFSRFLKALEQYLLPDKRITAIRLTPLEALTFAVHEEGPMREEALSLIRLMEAEGYHLLPGDLYEDASLQPRYLYVKEIGGMSRDEVFSSINARVRSHMQVCHRYGMELCFLQPEERVIFNELLKKTAIRTKTHPDILSFSPCREGAENKALLYPAVFLIPEKALELNQKEQEACEEEYRQQEEAPLKSKKAAGRLIQIEQRLNAAKKRQQRLENICRKVSDPGERIYLAAAQFALSPSDCINLQSGTDDDYLDLSPVYLIHEVMLERAVEEKISYYNFFAISSPDDDAVDDGVHRFKEQFNGRIERYPGTYEKSLRRPPLLAILEKLR